MAIIPVAEEVAASTGMLTWLSRAVGVAAPLADLLFGHGHSEPARNNSIGPFASWLKAPAVVMHDMFAELITTSQVTYNTILAQLRLRAAGDQQSKQYAQGLYNRAIVHANVVAHRAEQYAQGLYTRAVVHANVVAHQAELVAQGLYNRAIGYADAVGAKTAAHADVVAHRAEQYAQGLYVRGVAQTVAVGKAGKVYADTVSTAAAARASAKLGTDSASALAPSWQGVRSDLEAAAAVFGVGQPAITALIRQLPVAAPASMPAAEAATGKALRVLTKMAEDCVAPNCRNTSKFGKDLQSLFGLVEGAAFLAFLAFIINDPDAAVRETFDVLDGVTHTVIDGARHLVGV